MANNDSAKYIHMVQHLIEECILFNMSKEECMEALSKHANIKPVITSTVWKELEKENKEFFEAYTKRREERGEEEIREGYDQKETIQRINKILLLDSPSSSSKDTNNNNDDDE